MRTQTQGADVARDSEFPPPDTARAREAAAAADQSGHETTRQRRRRHFRLGRLQGSALAGVVFAALLVALLAANTARVRVDWLVGSSRVSLVWLVLAAAVIGWILGVLASARFQWLTRPPRGARPPRPEH